MESQSEFQLSVPAAQFERAKDLLGIQIAHGEKTDCPSDDEIQAAMELPLQDDLSVIAHETRQDWDPDSWSPEDATVEVWGGNKKWHGETIELSLRENRIHFRSNSKQGIRKVFVMPEDEARAREIVKEVVEGVPPE